MSLSKTEQVLTALLARLQTIEGATAERNVDRPDELDGEHVILRDGDADSERVLGVEEWIWTRDAEVEAYVAGTDAAARDAALDTLLQKIGAAVDGDPTLSGLVDYIGAEDPVTGQDAEEGTATVKVGRVKVRLEYSSNSALG